MPKDTRNSLTDFDLCVALAQQAINSQMAYAWKAWKKRQGFQDTIEIFRTKAGKPSKYGLRAKLSADEPIRIDLNVSNVKFAQVRVTLLLASGTVTYFDEFGGGSASEPIEDWSVSFITDLDRKPVDLELLRIIDPDTRRTADDVIKKTGLPDAVFSIEYLFLKFTQVNLRLADSDNIQIPAGVPPAARDQALTSLNYLLHGDNGDFLLGTVVRRNALQATPTFAMTDFVFNVNPNRQWPDASTLAYLGMMANRPLPQDMSIARSRVMDPWLSREDIDGSEESVSGVMAISRGVFMEKYLIPKFTAALDADRAKLNHAADGPPIAPLREGSMRWTYRGGYEVRQQDRDILELDYEFGGRWEVTLALKAETNRIELSGRIDSKALMDGYTLGSRGKSAFHTEWIHMEGHQNFSGDLQLVGSGIAEEFGLNPQLTYRFDDSVTVDNNSVTGGAVVRTAFEGLFHSMGFPGKTTAERLANSMQSAITALKGALETALRKVEVDLSEHAFIPPGGGVFTFNKPRFSKAGDLIWYVIYIAP